MPKMSFLPELQEFLNNHNLIYTVRKYKMDDRFVEVQGVGKCFRELKCYIDCEADLQPFVELSSFSDTGSWWKKIKYFIPSSNSPKCLYRIVKVGKLNAGV